MKKLEASDFQIIPVGEGNYYMEYKFNDKTVCIEPCFAGFCVAIYDNKKDIIGDKVCTDLKDDRFLLRVTRFSPPMRTNNFGDLQASIIALEIANSLVEKLSKSKSPKAKS